MGGALSPEAAMPTIQEEGDGNLDEDLPVLDGRDLIEHDPNEADDPEKEMTELLMEFDPEEPSTGTSVLIKIMQETGQLHMKC